MSKFDIEKYTKVAGKYDMHIYNPRTNSYGFKKYKNIFEKHANYTGNGLYKNLAVRTHEERVLYLKDIIEEYKPMAKEATGRIKGIYQGIVKYHERYLRFCQKHPDISSSRGGVK